ncbi:uncharacterized protein FA14DRAFT_181920 [Meira miltonrushii]|uniref:Uncharacterized protein n=1 Tax=Meira miltonrushii TaxID=1280837 RepID=A0A316V6A1_9BASI|nr:uncharacterized protein FA14DRAFT_181920 [Meira miltonrushii]PWN32001.1 hypothetical protein FA14DRAFT_181920 [Meira miltonrushii]
MSPPSSTFVDPQVHNIAGRHAAEMNKETTNPSKPGKRKRGAAMTEEQRIANCISTKKYRDKVKLTNKEVFTEYEKQRYQKRKAAMMQLSSEEQANIKAKKKEADKRYRENLKKRIGHTKFTTVHMQNYRRLEETSQLTDAQKREREKHLEANHHTSNHSMQILLLLLLSLVFIPLVAFAWSETSTGAFNPPYIALHDDATSTFKPNSDGVHLEKSQARPSKKRKELPDLNKSPPVSEAEEFTERKKRVLTKNRYRTAASALSIKEIAKQKRKIKYQEECDKFRRLPAHKKEEARVKAVNKSRKYREKLKLKTGVTSKKVLRFQELQALRKTAGNGSNGSSPNTPTDFDWTSYLVDTEDHPLMSPIGSSVQTQPVDQSGSHQKDKQAVSHATSLAGSYLPEHPKKTEKRKNRKPYSWPEEKAKIERMTPEQKKYRKIYSRTRQQRYSNRLMEEIGFSSHHNARLHQYRNLKEKGQASEEQLAYLKKYQEKSKKQQEAFQARRRAMRLSQRNKKE